MFLCGPWAENDYYIFIATLFIYLLFIFGCVGSSVRARAFSGYGKRGPPLIAVRGLLFIAVRGPLTIAAPPVAGHRLQTRRLSSCGPRAQVLRGMWDPPRPGLEPVSPALAGRFSTTAPPGKPYYIFKKYCSKAAAQQQQQELEEEEEEKKEKEEKEIETIYCSQS